MRLPAVQFGPAPLINPPTPNICSIDLPLLYSHLEPQLSIL